MFGGWAWVKLVSDFASPDSMSVCNSISVEDAAEMPAEMPQHSFWVCNPLV